MKKNARKYNSQSDPSLSFWTVGPILEITKYNQDASPSRTVHKWATGWGWQRTVIQLSVRNNNRVLNVCRRQCIRINNASTGQFVLVHGTGFAHGKTGTRSIGHADTCREFS